jgi:hypothetical protein
VEILTKEPQEAPIPSQVEAVRACLLAWLLTEQGALLRQQHRLGDDLLRQQSTPFHPYLQQAARWAVGEAAVATTRPQAAPAAWSLNGSIEVTHD